MLRGNELPFNSVEFKNFLRSSGTESNGRVENAVKTAKGLIKKAKASGANCFLSLLSWRNTSTEGLGTLLAQRMFGQRTQTHHQGALTIGERGDRVMSLLHDKSQTWFKEEIKELADVRSYKVKTEHGRILRRNHRHLCRSREPPFYSSRPREAPVALQPPDMAASPEKLQGPQPTEGQSFPTGPAQGDQSKQLTKTLLQYLARPNLCEQHLTSLGQLKIGSQELVGCQSHLAI